MAAAAAAQQAANAANNISTNAFAIAAYNNYGPEVFRIQANLLDAQRLAQNKITTNQSNIAEQHSAVSLGSAGLAGFGVAEMRQQLTDNINTTGNVNQASLVQNLNTVTNEGSKQVLDAQKDLNSANQASSYASLGGSAFGLIGSIIGGLYGLYKGGSGPSGNSIIAQPEYTASTMESNLNIGYVGGQRGNPTSVGTTNFVNETTASVNEQNAQLNIGTPEQTMTEHVQNVKDLVSGNNLPSTSSKSSENTELAEMSADVKPSTSEGSVQTPGVNVSDTSMQAETPV